MFTSLHENIKISSFKVRTFIMVLQLISFSLIGNREKA